MLDLAAIVLVSVGLGVLISALAFIAIEGGAAFLKAARRLVFGPNSGGEGSDNG